MDKAFQWAESNKKSRVNHSHGEPEAFLVISDTFALTSTDIEETDQSGSMHVQDSFQA